MDALTSLLDGGKTGEDEVLEVEKPPAILNDDVKRSVSMSQLLESRTFVRNFAGSKNSRNKMRKKQLLFVIER